MKKKVTLEKDIEVTSSTPDDPRLKKRWGYISALPSEYLIHFRRGKINEKTSGQGGNCFKLLKDTTFIIPTSLKEIIFEANQLTKDDVDVRIRGMAVYRISDPLRIYKLLNFSNRQSAEEKLARMIGDMCRSTSKWLVANMGVSECIRKRKEEIAESLKEEASRVVSHGETGWGVEIVTIDIQDVYIQDEEIFNAMQMMYKTGKIRESRMAQMEMERTLEMKALEKERDIAEHRKETELSKARIDIEIKNEKMEMAKDLEIKRLEQKREMAEHQKTTELDTVKNTAEIKDEEIRLSKQNEGCQFDLDQFRVEQNEAIAKYKFTQEMEREKQRMEMHLEKTRNQVAAEKMMHDEEVNALEKKIRAENSASSTNLEKLFIETALPGIAEVMANSMQNIKINMFQHGEHMKTPFSFALTELLQVFRETMAPLRGGGGPDCLEPETGADDPPAMETSPPAPESVKPQQDEEPPKEPPSE